MKAGTIKMAGGPNARQSHNATLDEISSVHAFASSTRSQNRKQGRFFVWTDQPANQWELIA